MHHIIIGLLAWIGVNSNYNTELSTPNIVMTELHNMCAQYGITHKKRCHDSRLQGFYNKHQTIYLKLDFKAEDGNNAQNWFMNLFTMCNGKMAVTKQLASVILNWRLT